ncbi:MULTISPECIES: bifunctional 4-hydroxy-2-oxoglutarate aldolase/2-dehydro-3-deoxy-phosphogluconate aldolase [Aquimarina]|uniref:2-dehydro-3-deoxyphosphogluconate aldolase / (4S)-4-hydroxy-2-oxoglutarate aldolase n=2 Tax=Aquimarina TaxID=290174 RepID=A0A1M6A0Y2_9FLAO|nr:MULTISPECIES: bifunctional 4-hydroxy-2-oxoglutarate aldolase/2-dehydro-3-deoxy-phosphogluconate aldolase [Aquimarina]TPN84414.1 bifunctional 4-hydroxy-2-oxoglutarate aldolase/2-dehydro-3-deoxy-phosphogluconate aldolase [Aquimarina algicola]SHI30167.1 2-dehydro-3-deoxyphosphogluconate aldolase / (4S)-4-hydroxy-2-oxoglutarate aldolase [Aquimarina spongiae]
MHDQVFSWKKFEQTPIVGILRGYTLETVIKIIPAYLKSGFYTIEITMNSPNAVTSIKELVSSFPELNVGAGTVCSMKELAEALNAGAQFIVTPIINEEVISSCVSAKIPVFPGAYTPTEIYKAWSLGADMVKVFPATQLGTQFIQDIKGPLKEIPLLPTGGVSKQNITDFLNVGCQGVGMGSSLFDKNLIENNDLVGLADHFKSITSVLKR